MLAVTLSILGSDNVVARVDEPRLPLIGNGVGDEDGL